MSTDFFEFASPKMNELFSQLVLLTILVCGFVNFVKVEEKGGNGSNAQLHFMVLNIPHDILHHYL